MSKQMSSKLDNKRDEWLSLATCRVSQDGKDRGTAWIVDASERLLLTAGHVIARKAPAPVTVDLCFLDAEKLQAEVVEWVYEPETGLDFAVLRIKEPIILDKRILDVSVANSCRGTFYEIGYPKGEEGQSPATGTFVGIFRRHNSTKRALFRLESTMSAKEGFSGSAIYSDDIGKIVGIHTEGAANVVGAGANSVLALPLFRVAERWPQLLDLGSGDQRSDSSLGIKQGLGVMDVISMVTYAGWSAAFGFLLCLLLFINFSLKRADIDLLSIRVSAESVHVFLGPLLLLVNILILVFIGGVLFSDVTQQELTRLQQVEILRIFGPLFNPFFLSGKLWIDAVGYAFLIVLWWLGMHTFSYSLRLNNLAPLLMSWNLIISGLYLVCGLASMLAIQACFVKFGMDAYRAKQYFSFLGIGFGCVGLHFILTRTLP